MDCGRAGEVLQRIVGTSGEMNQRIMDLLRDFRRQQLGPDPG